MNRDDLDTFINEMFETFHSTDVEQLASLDAANALIDHLLREAVQSLFSSGSRYLIAESLFKFGAKVVPELETRLNEGGDPEALAYAALILLKLGLVKAAFS